MIGFDIYYPLFDEVLNGRLNPMCTENADGHEYSVRISEMVHYHQPDTGSYGIVFHQPFNLKTRYYQQLLLSELNIFVDDIQQMITVENNPKIRAYMRDQLLDKHLSFCLKKLGEKIRKEGLWLVNIQAPDVDNNRRSDIYVFHYLKICIAKAYLEIQEILSDVVAFHQTEEWLYSTHAGEALPVEKWIKHRKGSSEEPARTVSDPGFGELNAFNPVNYYSSAEVRQILDFSEATLTRRIKKKGFPQPLKKGRNKYFLKTDIETLRKDHL